MKHLKSILVSALLFGLGFSACAQQTAPEDVIAKLNVPQGFSISLFARNLPNVRSLAFGDDGVVFAGTGREGKVYALQDKDRDGAAETLYVLADGLTMPNGVAYKDGALYVAEISRILRYDNVLQNLASPPKPSVVYDKLPTDRHHGWKYLRIGPDGKLYTAVGAPCNICNPERPVYASLVRVDTDGNNFEILGRGIRNTVGFDWQPGTEGLFFSDNGRDYLGDDLPPDELNRWSRIGEHFGYPFCHGDAIADPEYGKGKQCSDYTPPVWKFNAHVAALGIRFYRGEQFPEHYRNQLFVAQHGSWNRSVPDGYRVVLVTFRDNKPVDQEVFIDGWLTKEEKVLGRPVDVLTLPDGSLLISDDQLGVIYKVQYKRGK
ncbi:MULTISPECIES: PQQ-dependent sugar dehydrogenase [Methylomicrobium]|uniref:Glucose/sorbosone dehydrogenase n=1 Tax=Methylomicrobium album BG8 TaxID=686340 RepID=H8GNN5_METAL|nr:MULTISPECIES: PQQ-dependent sugar dehydrogenase [Methylomicrobium]EIC30791.1 glucose/sorbosone dehydrogenase [Methylomicrobium album BG8]